MTNKTSLPVYLRMPIFLCAVLCVFSSVSLRADSYVDEDAVRAARVEKIKRVAKIAAVATVGVIAAASGGAYALHCANVRRWRNMQAAEDVRREFARGVCDLNYNDEPPARTNIVQEERRSWTALSGHLVQQERRERQEALQRQQARERRLADLTRGLRQLEVDEQRARGDLRDYCYLACGIVREEYAARMQLERRYIFCRQFCSPEQCARRARIACEEEALAGRRDIISQEERARADLTAHKQQHIVPYLQMLKEQRQALIGQEQQAREGEFQDEQHVREEVACYYEQHIAPYLAMRQRYVDERHELCKQERAVRGFGLGQSIRLHAMTWLLRGFAADEVRERNDLMRKHQAYLEQQEQVAMEQMHAASNALCRNEEYARRAVQHDEDRLRSSQFLNFWMIRALRLQGRHVPRGHDAVINRFGGSDIRQVMEELELLTPAQLDELELREMLGLPIAADHAAVKRSYRSFCIENHPDKTASLPQAERQRRATQLAQMTDIYKRVDGQAKLRQISAKERARKRDAELEALRQKHREQLKSHDDHAIEELRALPMTSFLWSMKNAELQRERRDIVVSQERDRRRFQAENPEEHDASETSVSDEEIVHEPMDLD